MNDKIFIRFKVHDDYNYVDYDLIKVIYRYKSDYYNSEIALTDGSSFFCNDTAEDAYESLLEQVREHRKLVGELPVQKCQN